MSVRKTVENNVFWNLGTSLPTSDFADPHYPIIIQTCQKMFPRPSFHILVFCNFIFAHEL
jgi:hypothetical protein